MVLRRLTLAAGLIVTVWGALIVLAHGSQVQLLGIKFSSQHPLLLFWGGAAMLAIYVCVWRPPLERHVSSVAMLSPRRGAVATAAVALAVFAASMHWGSVVAGGADSHGYVSQAGLWRQGALLIRGDIIRQSPWPLAIETWAPLGYRPAEGRRDGVAPLYPPGLPILMALFQLLLGYCGAFYVVPLSAAAAVTLTYALGLRIFDRPAPALWAALLVATSPVFLYQAMSPMTDVPCTAAGVLAFWLLAASRPFAAGLAMTVSLAIRPNLVLVPAALLLWTARTNWRAAVWLAIGVAPAVAGIAWFNLYLYRSPLISGYGSLDSLYAASYVWKNVSQFTTWMLETQTPIVFASVAFFVMARRWSIEAKIRRPRLFVGGVMLAVVISYVFYLPFEGWTYLRFLLPMWPLLMLTTTTALDAAARRWTRAMPAAHALALGCIALAAWRGVDIAEARGAFDLWRGEQRYVDVGRYLASHTDARAVILSFQHSGSIRLYGDRLTLRWDQLQTPWLDRAVEYLASTGRHPYIVVDGEEVALFRKLFEPANRLGALDWTPVAVLQRPRVEIYDAADRRDRRPDTIPSSSGRRPGWRCERPQRWPTPLRME